MLGKACKVINHPAILMGPHPFTLALNVPLEPCGADDLASFGI